MCSALAHFFSFVRTPPAFHACSILLSVRYLKQPWPFRYVRVEDRSFNFTVSKFRITRFTWSVVTSGFLYWNRHSLLFVPIMLSGFCLYRNVLCHRFYVEDICCKPLKLPGVALQMIFSSLNSENLIGLYRVLILFPDILYYIT